MRAIILALLLAVSTSLVSACSTIPVNGNPVAAAPVNADCDEYEGYPDCYPDHPLSR